MFSDNVWLSALIGYLVTVAIETPILMLVLARDIKLRTRFALGLWLTGCTYPIVSLVLPPLLIHGDDRLVYLLVAETFAPAAECALFYWKMDRLGARNAGAILLANLASFGVGRVIYLSLVG